MSVVRGIENEDKNECIMFVSSDLFRRPELVRGLQLPHGYGCCSGHAEI